MTSQQLDNYGPSTETKLWLHTLVYMTLQQLDVVHQKELWLHTLVGIFFTSGGSHGLCAATILCMSGYALSGYICQCALYVWSYIGNLVIHVPTKIALEKKQLKSLFDIIE